MEALRSDVDIDLLLVQRKSNSGLSEVIASARDRGVLIKQVPTEKLNRTVRNEHQGVIAFINKVPPADLDELITRVYEKGGVPLVLITDGVTDVRNIGAIARSTECLGAHALVVPELGSARLGSDAVKSSAGALIRVPVCRVKNMKDTLALCRAHGLKVIGITEKGTQSIEQCDLLQPLAIVLGAEHDGLSNPVLRSADELALIPMSGSIGSLNVSVAAGIALFEVSRQRRS